MVKWLTRRSAKPISAGSNPALGSYRELAQWLARKSYILTVSGSSPKHEGQFLKITPFYKSLIINTLLLSGFILCYLVLSKTACKFACK